MPVALDAIVSVPVSFTEFLGNRDAGDYYYLYVWDSADAFQHGHQSHTLHI